jgi:hypothetical protein
MGIDVDGGHFEQVNLSDLVTVGKCGESSEPRMFTIEVPHTVFQQLASMAMLVPPGGILIVELKKGATLLSSEAASVELPPGSRIAIVLTGDPE